MRVPANVIRVLLPLLLSFPAAGAHAEAPTFVYETVISGYHLAAGHTVVLDAEGNAYVAARTVDSFGSLLLKIDPSGAVGEIPG